jgi:hypothetical protein
VSRRTLEALALVAFAAGGVAAAGCGDQSDAAREARRVFTDAPLAGSSTCSPGSAQRTAEAFETSCEMSLASDWSEYKRSLRSRMEPQYQLRTETAESVVFSRGLSGDLYTVSVILRNGGATKSVRLTFRAAPW